MKADRVIRRSLPVRLLATFFAVAGSLRAGPEPLTDNDGKDYSKEAPPIEKSWCETPTSLEIRVGLPAWLAGLSGDNGVKGGFDLVGVSFGPLLRALAHVPISVGAY